MSASIFLLGDGKARHTQFQPLATLPLYLGAGRIDFKITVLIARLLAAFCFPHLCLSGPPVSLVANAPPHPSSSLFSFIMTPPQALSEP